jgi:hypothetical protein
VRHRRSFATHEEAAEAGRLYAAGILRDLALAMLTLKGLGFESAQIELTAPIKGVAAGFQRNPITALRMALEQGVCANPGAAAELLAKLSKLAGLQDAKA